MSYEIRMIVASIPQEDSDEYQFKRDGALYARTLADFYLGKVDYDGPYHDLFQKARTQDRGSYYLHSMDDGDEEVTIKDDKYGKPLVRLELSETIEALEIEVENWPDYPPLRVALDLLRSFQEHGYQFSEIKDIIVLHYGH